MFVNLCFKIEFKIWFQIGLKLKLKFVNLCFKIEFKIGFQFGLKLVKVKVKIRSKGDEINSVDISALCQRAVFSTI